jgi:hypothetical protein
VEEYHKSLQATLTLLGHEHLCPTLKKLHEQLERKGLYAVLTACTVLPFVLADTKSIPDVEKVMKKEGSMPLSDKFKEVFKKLLLLFEKKGWLDLVTA